MVDYEHQVVAIFPADDEARNLKYGTLLGGPRLGDIDQRRRPRKDRDKLLYSEAWRRLAGVTQVISPGPEDAHLHTRLTHSEKVAQVAWSLANHMLRAPDWIDKHDTIAKWGGLDLDMVEAAALAHDLGHPPFGHIAEPVLDQFAIDIGLEEGYEGNAQSFRIIRHLIKWTPEDTRGVGLSPGTLAATLKYPWSRAQTTTHQLPGSGEQRDGSVPPTTDSPAPPKFGFYKEDSHAATEARQWFSLQAQKSIEEQATAGLSFDFSQTIEASIMDIADDITYAFHDFEDFLLSGAIDAAAILRQAQAHLDPNTQSPWFEDLRDKLSSKNPQFKPDQFNSAVGRVKRILAMVRDKHEARRLSQEARNSFIVSKLLDMVISDLTITNGPAWANGPIATLQGVGWHLVAVMKAITLGFVIQSPAIALQQRAQTRMVDDLLREVHDWAKRDPMRLPPLLSSQLTFSDLSTETPLRDTVMSTLYLRYESEVKHVQQGAKKLHARPERYIIDAVAALDDERAKRLHAYLTQLHAPPTVATSWFARA